MSGTSSRKLHHVNICLEKPVSFHTKSAGFEQFDWVHCALPELDFNDVETAVTFLNKGLSWPFMIGAMTGGHADVSDMNRDLARIAAQLGIAMALGSQRAMLEDPSLAGSYRVVREHNPDGVIVANIGGVQLASLKDVGRALQLVDSVEADGLAVHLNPLQELLQPEGDRDFRNIARAVADLVKVSPVPVLVKEVGCGISKDVAERLMDAGVTWLEVAGAGGTSWAAIEGYRQQDQALAEQFRDWGIPTAQCLCALHDLPDVHLIASGGIDSGLTAAKAIALGAELSASALPVLRLLHDSSVEEAVSILKTWQQAFQMALLLTGCRNVQDLKAKAPLRAVR